MGYGSSLLPSIIRRAKSGQRLTQNPQRLHSIGLAARGYPSSLRRNTLWVHSSIQIPQRLHHLSKIKKETSGYLLFFFFSVYLTLVFFDNNNHYLCYTTRAGSISSLTLIQPFHRSWLDWFLHECRLPSRQHSFLLQFLYRQR